MRLSLPLKLLSVLCLHFLLLGADEAQTTTPAKGELANILADARKLLTTNHVPEAIEAAQHAASLALRTDDNAGQANALNIIGSGQLLLFHYRDALQTLNASRAAAQRAKDATSEGGTDVNLATTYAQLGDFDLASKEASNAVKLLQNSPRQDALARALMVLGTARMELHDTNAGRNAFRQAITVAQQATLDPVVSANLKVGLKGLESLGWDHLGRSLLDDNHLDEAEKALMEAYRLRVMAADQQYLAITRIHLAELNFRRKNYNAALNMIDAALASPNGILTQVPPFFPFHIRGQILWALGKTSPALTDLRKAVEAADRWRRSALPGDTSSTRTASYQHLNSVYQDFAELAATLALERHDNQLAREAQEVLSENRAASLREQLAFSLQRQDRLPPEYFELISRLKAAQSRATLDKFSEDETNTEAIRLELAELEDKIGLQLENITPQGEKKPSRKTLRDIQRRLSDKQLLLNFSLGKTKSFLWAITGERVTLYQLPAENEVSRQALAFARATQDSRDASVPGQALNRELFGQLDSDLRRRPEWLLVGDGALLNGIPFSALPQTRGPSSTGTISESHSIRLLPTALLLASPPAESSNRAFVGIGDPIYNSADPRIKGSRLLRQTSAPSAVPLARLPGSGREIRTVAKLSGISNITMLLGPEASVSKVTETLAQEPDLVHFAVHVVSPEDRPQEAALALSLTSDGLPELLTSEAIATFKVPGSLVILNGCSSDQGKALPGAGLMGLSRAWLLAGAKAVIVTSWPIPDDSGQFFSVFYKRLNSPENKTGPLAERAAIALQQAQLEMQHSTTYRRSPSFWAAYSVIAKE